MTPIFYNLLIKLSFLLFWFYHMNTGNVFSSSFFKYCEICKLSMIKKYLGNAQQVIFNS